MRIPLAAPDITDSDVELVTATLRSGSLSLGARLPAFERAFATQVGTAEGVAVSSGTAGLHLAIRACGIGAGDEVITTPFSFVASVNAILYERAVPVFVDIDPVSLNLDPDRIEAAITPRTRGILVVHVFGRPADMPRIMAIAARHRLVVIEDACEALGAEIGGRQAGSHGACGVFGFYPNKQITTGEGGMIVTDDPRLSAECRSMRNHGRNGDATEPAGLGYNYRLSELACALGLGQLSRLDTMLASRRALAERYDQRLAGHSSVTPPPLDVPGGRQSWFVYVVRLASDFSREDRDGIAAELVRQGIGCGRYFGALHLHPHVQQVCGPTRGAFPLAEAASDRTLALPFFSRMTSGQLDEVCEALLALVSARRRANAR